MSNFTEKQRAFLEAYSEALAEHYAGDEMHWFSISTLSFAIESVGIDRGTPEYVQAYELLFSHSGLRAMQIPNLKSVSGSLALSTNKPKEGFVYILKNDSFPDLVKIGYTTQERLETRVRQLSSSTGVPTPFEVVHFIKTNSPKDLEAFVHESLDKFRLPPKEFFNCDLDVAIAACNQCHQDMRGEA